MLVMPIQRRQAENSYVLLVFEIRAMTGADAAAIAAWRYPAPYDFYDWDRDPDDLAQLLDPAGHGVRYFAADEGGRLAGFFEFTPGEEEVEVGLGLRPDLTGRGRGQEFLAAGLEFAEARYGARRWGLAVAAFNLRAIAVYERAGFREVRRYEHFTNGAVHAFVWMTCAHHWRE
jgi:ribosomal-protein-alanine N-acetyltransferase